MIVIPMPIYFGHGHIDPTTAFALWIVLNGLCIIASIGYTVAYVIKKPYYSWIDGLTGYTIGGIAITVIFALVNFMALLVYLVNLVKSLIEK